MLTPGVHRLAVNIFTTPPLLQILGVRPPAPRGQELPGHKETT